MASKGNGTTSNILTNTTITGPTRYTWHMIYRNASAPAVATGKIVFSISNATDSSGTYWVAFNWNQPSTPKTMFHKNSGGTFNSATFGTALSGNTDYAMGGRYDGTNVDVFLNGVNDGAAVATDPTGATTPKISIHAGGNTGATGPDDGTVAEFALWNTNLTDTEMSALGKRLSPLLVRPASLVIYLPLIRSSIARLGPAVTASNTTVATHPRAIHAARDDSWDRQQVFTKSVNMNMSLGTSESDLLDPNIANSVSMNGVFGLASQLGINYQQVAMALKVGMKIRAKAGGAIASGRFREREGQKDG